MPPSESRARRGGDPVRSSALLFLSIGAVPLWMVPLHAVCQRLLQGFRRDFSVQVSALVAVVLVDLIYVAALTFGRDILAADLPNRIAGWAFVAIAVNAMAFFYFQLVNVALTSIHMAVLLRINWAGCLSRQALMARYGREHMVDERIRRLVQLGQLERDGEVVRLRSRTLAVLSAPIYLWRRMLGLGS